jgi:hypothetical protein
MDGFPCNMRHTSTDSEGWEGIFRMLTIYELKIYDFATNLIYCRIKSQMKWEIRRQTAVYSLVDTLLLKLGS